jgi:hypothetical protein
MRKRHAMLVAAFAVFSINATAADFSGYVIDQNCAGDASMKGNETCARKCIRKGSPAVLLTPTRRFTSWMIRLRWWNMPVRR